MSQDGQYPADRLRAGLEDVPRPVVALPGDYPDGHQIAPHAHRRAQLVYAVQGVMTLRTADATWVVPPTRAVWMPGGVEHAIAIAGPLQMRTLYVLPDAVPGLPAQGCGVNVSPLLRELIVAAVALPQPYPLGGAEERLVGVLLDQLRGLRQTPLHLPMPRDRRLRRIAAALEADPADPRDLDGWGRAVGASPRTLARHFRTETGLTFGHWRRQLRLLLALRRLAAGEAVTGVAIDLGYASPSAFIASFRRTFGVTPGRYFDPPLD
jgi:AraC-like DNA-binding protein